MPRRLTEEEANIKDIQCGAIPIGPYKGNKIKRKYECTICGKYYMATPNQVKYYGKTRCNDCIKGVWTQEQKQLLLNNYPYLYEKQLLKMFPGRSMKALSIKYSRINIEAGNCKRSPSKVKNEEALLNKLTETIFPNLSPIYSHGYCRLDIKCWWICPNCGICFKRCPCEVIYQKQVVCRECSILFQSRNRCKTLNEAKYVLKKFNMDIDEDSYISFAKKSTIICSCGRCFKSTITNIQCGHISSCGHCNDPRIGDREGKLVVEKKKENNGKGCLIRCRCDCGNLTIWKDGYYFYSGVWKSCGQCCNMRNGVLTSFKALELHDIIEEIVGHPCYHNHTIDGKCFDTVDLDNRITVEYDEHHWHRKLQDTTKKEKADTRLAIKHGFKMLRVRAHKDLPTKEQLKKAINNHFEHGAKQHTITTPGWKNASIK